jgi:hypothetical protein
VFCYLSLNPRSDEVSHFEAHSHLSFFFVVLTSECPDFDKTKLIQNSKSFEKQVHIDKNLVVPSHNMDLSQKAAIFVHTIH